MPVIIPDKAKVEIAGSKVTVTGAKGTLVHTIHPEISAKIEGKELLVSRPSDQKRHRALHGLTRALIQNMVTGVTEGFTRELEIIGVGFRAEAKGKVLQLNLGYSHPILFIPPEGIAIAYEAKENKLKISGADKALVGLTAAKIRSFRKPEPYKGKGVRYVGEQVRTKAGKTAG